MKIDVLTFIFLYDSFFRFFFLGHSCLNCCSAQDIRNKSLFSICSIGWFDLKSSVTENSKKLKSLRLTENDSLSKLGDGDSGCTSNLLLIAVIANERTRVDGDINFCSAAD
jgi:hypothetical protein